MSASASGCSLRVMPVNSAKVPRVMSLGSGRVRRSQSPRALGSWQNGAPVHAIAVVIHRQRTDAPATERPEYARQVRGVRIRINAFQQFAAGDHDHVIERLDATGRGSGSAAGTPNSHGRRPARITAAKKGFRGSCGFSLCGQDCSARRPRVNLEAAAANLTLEESRAKIVSK